MIVNVSGSETEYGYSVVPRLAAQGAHRAETTDLMSEKDLSALELSALQRHWLLAAPFYSIVYTSCSGPAVRLRFSSVSLLLSCRVAVFSL